MSDPNPLNLLAIVGTTRSGSTLLDMLLGDTPAVFSGGELRTIWKRCYLKGQPCSCGEPIQHCEFWSEVMATAFGSVGQPDPAPHHVAEWQRTALRQRHTRRIARSVATDPDLADHPKLRNYRQTLLQLYQTIAAVSGRRWIVDSSKLGSDVALVGPVPALHTRLLHLTRDPRGVVYSWSRGHATPSSPWSFMPLRGPRQSTLDWLRLNASAEIALRSVGRGRVSRLRYEDLAADPFAELGRLSAELGVPVNQDRIADESVMLAPNHLIGGNPVRFRREVTIRPDDEWVSAMPRSTKLLIGAATSPLLLKYGYSLSGPPGKAPPMSRGRRSEMGIRTDPAAPLSGLSASSELRHSDMHRSSARPSAAFASVGPVTIAALLTCHNRREHTLACLGGLRATAIPEITVDAHLVDDASNDGTAEAVAAAYPAVKITRGSGDLFWGGGMRLAFTRAVPACPDYLLWLNDDVVLDQDALERLLATYDALRAGRQQLSVVVGSTRDPHTGATTYGGLRRTSRLRRMAFAQVAPTDTPQSCDTMNGNVVLIPRSVYSVVGNIDERFTHAMGDLDYGLRARAAGCHVVLAPGHVGACRVNPPADTFRDEALSRRERLRRAASLKGLPVAEWAALCRRHGGPLWPALALSPYVRMMLGRPRPIGPCEWQG